MSLDSQKMVIDPSAFYEKAPSMIVTSRDGKYIAAQLYGGDILIWKVRGIDLPASCTIADRRALHELDMMYRIGQERNKQYNRDYVVRLNPRQWSKFEELSRRPECEVPHDWKRLFRKLK